MTNSEEEDTSIYKVVVNDEEQYSIWPHWRDNPPGWRDVAFTAKRTECLKHIAEIWTDMRPLSLRRRMAELDIATVTDHRTPSGT